MTEFITSRCRDPRLYINFTFEVLASMALVKVKELVTSHGVFVFSMTYCSFCQKVKDLFSSLNVKNKVMELDKEIDGSEIQSVLIDWTRGKNVPYVFIGGKFIGGWDSILTKHRRGRLTPLLKAINAL